MCIAASFIWSIQCKSEVTTMGFISKIAVFLSRETISKYYFYNIFSLILFPSSNSRPRPKHFLITQPSLLRKGKNKYTYSFASCENPYFQNKTHGGYLTLAWRTPIKAWGKGGTKRYYPLIGLLITQHIFWKNGKKLFLPDCPLN